MNTFLRNALVICTLVAGTMSMVNAAKKQPQRRAVAMAKKGAQLKRKHALYTGRTYRGCQREANRPKRSSAQKECTTKGCNQKK